MLLAGSSLLTLLDDIATLLDDISVMGKLAAKKTAGNGRFCTLEWGFFSIPAYFEARN